MFLELPKLWIVVLNVFGIPAIHLGVSWLFTRMPRRWFNPASPFFRERSCENGGRLYESVFKIRRWKRLLPDAAPWFDGFAKKNLRSVDPDYLRAFIAETCRGEAAHVAQVFALAGILLLWNPWPVAAIVMIVYAIFSNLPCILLQRHTRIRLQHFAGKPGVAAQGSGQVE
ncbi:MAG: hypothetical protein HKN23_11370 [Verrucomicrobiales bacterium]|nr:hypothetical protein [Verrucomicrobiales bacterium]